MAGVDGHSCEAGAPQRRPVLTIGERTADGGHPRLRGAGLFERLIVVGHDVGDGETLARAEDPQRLREDTAFVDRPGQSRQLESTTPQRLGQLGGVLA